MRCLCIIFAMLLSAPAVAAVSTSNQGGTTTVTITRAVPTSEWVDVRDDICRGGGWTAQVTCTQAMVDASQCNAGQLGNQVTNPETCLQAIDRLVRSLLRDLRLAGEVREADDMHVKPVRATDKSGDIQ